MSINIEPVASGGSVVGMWASSYREYFLFFATSRARPTAGSPGRWWQAKIEVVTGTGEVAGETHLILPSTGPDPIPSDTAVAAVLGYARGRRPFRFRSPGAPQGRWVQLPAFGWSRFDVRPVEPPGDADILVGEGLHGRLDRAGWHDVDDALTRVRPLVGALTERAGDRSFWELPADELSVLGEPGTVGAALRAIGRTSGSHPGHVVAALHHRQPGLVPHLTRTTRRALLPHTEEGDSGVEAVVWRELRANAAGFAVLEEAAAALLGLRPTRLRLHDILLWLSTTLRMAQALQFGRATEEWAAPQSLHRPHSASRGGQ